MIVTLLAVPSVADERLAEACAANVPAAGFADVEGGTHAVAIDCVAWWEVAQGDGQGRYRPGADVRRDQLASLLARFLAAAGRPPAPAGDQGFDDVAGNVHAEAIDALAAMGVVRGVSATRFAPGDPVRRDQMAALLVRLHEAVFDALPAGEESFEDTAGNVHAEAIGKLAAAGVTAGRTQTTFEPAGRVTRAQMASFLLRLLAVWVREDLVDVVGEDHPDLREGDQASFAPSVSASGRYVAFVSQASDLVDGDAGEAAQVFVRDRATGRTSLVSAGAGGQPGDADADAPSISGDGRYVAFTSHATNLVAGDTNEGADVFVHDRVSGATSRVSVASGGGQADGHSGAPAISADGRYVAFTSRAFNLVAGDSNATTDVFVHDRASGATSRVSVASGGGQADGPSGPPAISAEGRYVAFESEAADLVAGDTNDEPDVFAHDRDAQVTERVSVTEDGGQADGPSRAPSISPNGRYLAYETAAGNLLKFPTPTNPDTWHVLRLDRATTETDVVSHRADGPSHSPTLAGDGRVAFVSAGSDLPYPRPHNGLEHVYEWRSRDEPITHLSVDDEQGEQANAHSHQPAISANGLVVAYVSTATNLLPSTTGGTPNVLAHTWKKRLCVAVLISAASLLLAGDQPPPDSGEDDDERCEDRSTEPLLSRAEAVHEVMDDREQELRTTAAVRARNHRGDCVVVFAGGARHNLKGTQKEVLRPSQFELPAEPMTRADAEVTALTYIFEIRMWTPLALGIAPPHRVICEDCRRFIEHRGGQITSSRTAVWQ